MSPASRLLTVLALLNLVACGGCGDDNRPGRAEGPVVVETPPQVSSEATESAAYREAYERAVKEVDADNAREQLDLLQKEIDEDRSQ